MRLGIFTIVNADESFESFAIHKVEWADNKLGLSKVTRHNQGHDNSPCSCYESEFMYTPKCPRHNFFTFAFISEVEEKVNVFSRWSHLPRNTRAAKDVETFIFTPQFERGDSEIHYGAELALLWAVPCSRCGEPLTNPQSIAAGIGPVCAEKAGIVQPEIAEIVGLKDESTPELYVEETKELSSENEIQMLAIELDEANFQIFKMKEDLQIAISRRNTLEETISRKRTALRQEEAAKREAAREAEYKLWLEKQAALRAEREKAEAAQKIQKEAEMLAFISEEEPEF